MFLQGYTAYAISKILTDENVPSTADCGRWHGQTVRRMLQNGDYFWEKQKKSENLLEVYRAMDFQELAKSGQPLEKMETDFMLQVLDHIKVFEDGTLMLVQHKLSF